MARPKIADQYGDGHFGYGELLNPQNVNALITQHNEHAEALDALEEGSSVPSSTIQELRIAPEGPWYENPAENMPGGLVHNYVHPSLATNTVLIVHAADNEGTVLTGMSSADINPGDVRILVENQDPGLQDAGTIVFKHEDSGSNASNRFLCPGHHDYIMPPYGVTMMIYGEDSRWHIFGVNGRHLKTVTQSLQLYPKLVVGHGASPLSGTYNDFNPTGYGILGGSLGVSGSNLLFKDHTMIQCYTDAGGATITGLATSGMATSPADYGALKIIANYGPGELTLKHLDGGSAIENRLYCPGSADLVLKQYESAWFFMGYYDPDGLGQWHCVSVATGAGAVAGTFETMRLTPAQAPSALAAGRTDDWNPGDNSTFTHVTTNNSNSSLSGMVAGADGEVRILTNDGNGLLVLNDADTNSTAENRFYLGAPKIAIPSRSSAWMLYDDVQSRWRPVGRDSVFPAIRLYPAITPHTVDGVLANADIHDYAPTGWNYCQVWRLVPGGGSSALTGIGDGTQVDGQLVTIISYDNTLTIKHNNAGSSAANRFYLPGLANITLSIMCSATFRYDINNGLWNCIAKAL